MLLQERARTVTLLRRLPDTMTSRQARWAPPAAPGVAPRRAWIRSRWPDWVGPAAAAWSLGYGLLGLHWTLGGAGFPFGTEHDPHAARVSILEHIQQQPAAPVIATLGLGGAVLALVLARRRTRGPVGAALLGFAWTMAVALTVVIPDVRPLTGVARTPIVLVGLPFGWPPGVTLPSLFPWPVVNQFLLIGGGLLWAASGVAYYRRTRSACGHCGRSDATSGWTTPASAARWGRWATAVAVTVPLLYAVTRWAWALGVPLGVTREFLREEARDTPDIWLAGAALATLAVGGATLTLGLVERWGEVYPHWIAFLGGRPVRPRTAILPASLVAILMTSAGLGHWRAAVLGYFPEGSTGENWGTVAPGYLLPLWGVALGAATLGYHLRRRGRCPYCGRPDPSGG
jgi:hypothetical protein